MAASTSTPPTSATEAPDKPKAKRPPRKSKVAPPTPQPERGPRKPTPRTGPRDPGAHNDKRLLNPKQLQCLDLFSDPDMATISDIAFTMGIYPKTITRWIIENDLFREEYWRRIGMRAERLAALGVAGVEKSLKWAMGVLDSKDATFDEKYRAAKLLIDSQRIKVELNAAVAVNRSTHQHVHVAGPVPTKADSPEAIPAVRRIQATGASPDDALRVEAREMRILLDQIEASLTGGAEDGILEGELVGVADGEPPEDPAAKARG